MSELQSRMTKPDCMICLTPIRLVQWNPIKQCDCKVTVHKQCWNKWQETSKTCIICRKEEYEYQIFRVHLNVRDDATNLREARRILGCFLFVLIGMTVAIVYSALSLMRPYTSIKDEL